MESKFFPEVVKFGKKQYRWYKPHSFRNNFKQKVELNESRDRSKFDEKTFTHFLSIPLYFNSQIRSNYEELKEKILTDSKMNIDPDLFIFPCRIHITLLMLCLNSTSKLKKAISVLQEFEPKLKAIVNDKMTLKINGIESITGNKNEAKVIHGKVFIPEGSGIFNLVDELIKAMLANGLTSLKELTQSHVTIGDKYSIKYHMTILNSTFKAAKNHDKFKTFNASELLDLFENYPFGEHKVNQVDLSKRGEFDKESGFYRAEYKLIIK